MFVPVDEKYENEAPFQLYWFACNCTLTLVLTLVVKVKSISVAGVNFYEVLDLGNPSIVQDQRAFNTIILVIFLTGVVSQILFFLMKRMKCAMPSSPEEPSIIEVEKNDP